MALLLHADAQQAWLNLDFETAVSGRPWAWTYGLSGYEYTLDSATAVSGSQSFRIRRLSGTQTGTTVLQALPIALVRGKHLRVRGSVKTEAILNGFAALWMRVDGISGYLTIDNGPTGGVSGTSDWQAFTMERDVSPDAIAVVLGGLHVGNGTSWFDDLSVEVDGTPILQGAAPVFGEPTPAQLDWVGKSAIPIATPLAGSGFDDLAPVKAMVGDARIVGMGEGTQMIGAAASDGFTFTQDFTTEYDALIFFDQTTPTLTLPYN